MIELREVIRDLRTELAEAMQAGRDEALQFVLGPIEIELSVVVEKKGQAGAKVRFWVVEAGAQADISRLGGQKIKLVLRPEVAGSSREVRVADEATPKER